MATLVEYFKRQSNKANWSYQDQLCASDGNPLWTTDTDGIGVCLMAVDRRGCIAFEASSSDGTGQLTLQPNGVIVVDIHPSTLNALSDGLYDIHATISSDDFTVNRVYGRLPIYNGFAPSTRPTSPKVTKITTGQVIITTIETLIVPDRFGRIEVTVINDGDTPIYIGPHGVNASTGVMLAGVKGAHITFETELALYGVVASGSSTVSFVETY